MHKKDTLSDCGALVLGRTDIERKGDLGNLRLVRVGRVEALNDGVETAAAGFEDVENAALL